MASTLPRSCWTNARERDPLIQRDSPRAVAIRPSKLAASFSVVKGRPRSMRDTKPTFSRLHSSMSAPTSTCRPARRSLRMLLPEVRGSGSLMPTTTLRIPDASTTSTQGGVRPV